MSKTLKTIVGSGYTGLDSFCDNIRARMRVVGKSGEPQLTRIPRSLGSRRERKYTQKKNWQKGLISTVTYTEFLLQNGYSLEVIRKELGPENLNNVLKVMANATIKDEDDVVEQE